MTKAEVVSGPPAEHDRWRSLRESFSRTARTLGLGRGLRLSDLRTGHWFDRLATLYLRHHDRQLLAVYTPGFEDELQTRAQRVIQRSAMQTGVLGSSAATLATAAIWLTSETGGYGGVVALPAAAVGVGGDMVGRALLHLQMTCEIGDLYGVRFEPDDIADLSRLYALAFGIEDYRIHDEQEDDHGKRLIERVAELRGHEIGVAIGSKLMSETLVRNVIPFVGVAISGVGSYRLTKRVGNTVHDYVRYRAVVDPMIEELDSDSFDILTEGIWFVLSAEKPISHAGAALLAHLVNLRAPEIRDELSSRFLLDDSMWLDRLRAVRGETRARMLRTLESVAAVATPVHESSLAVLRRAADTLNQELDEERVQPTKRSRPRGEPERELH
jgi:hypothetical protein